MPEFLRWRYCRQRAIEAAQETTMKKHFHLLNGFRIIMLVAAALALYLPATNMSQQTAVAAQVTTQIELPEGIRLASARTSWQAVSALAY
jgi:hypothetical protein